MQEKYQKQGVMLLALSYEPQEKVAPFVKKYKLPYVVGDAAMETRDAFGIRGYPTMFLVDPTGNVAWRGHPDAVEPELEKLLKKKPPRGPGILSTGGAKSALKKADALYKGKKYAAALKAYKSIVKDFNGTTTARKAKKRVSDIVSDEELMASIRRAESERKAERWLSTARLLAANGAANDAARYYRRILKECPDTDQARQARKELKKITG
jgi:tetratricopeptide (TPR) repeat protein